LQVLVDQIIESGFARPDAARLYEIVSRAEDAVSTCFGPADFTRDFRR
jgi:hypothetical protein